MQLTSSSSKKWCCSSNNISEPTIISNTTVIYPKWAAAVHDNSMAAIKIMHSFDPDLINEAIDTQGSRAIHFAVKSENQILLNYLIENNANFNLQAGEHQNTPLHDAVVLKNKEIIQKLFSYGAIDDKILNIHGKTAVQLCTSLLYKREYFRAKKFKSRNLKNFRKKRKQTESLSATNENSDYSPSEIITISSLRLDIATKSQLIAYQKETDANEIWFRKKKSEIELRQYPATKFGKIIGIDVDAVGVKLKVKLDCEVYENNAGRMWRNLLAKQKNNLEIKKHISILDDKHSNPSTGQPLLITKVTQVNKLLTVLIASVLKNMSKKHGNRRSFSSLSFITQHQDNVRNLTVRICRKLPQKKGKIQLSEEIFSEKFYVYLFEIHEEMINEESREKRKGKHNR